ncbi:MAG: copper chaperone PCu(A)C [Pseudomonadota bacterium]
MFRFIFIFVTMIWMPFGAVAEEFNVGDLTISSLRAFETSPTARAAGGYLTIENNGTTDDQLIEVQADFPRVMIHETVETDGVARMQHVDMIQIPAGGAVVLEPGGLHVMFMGLSGTPFVTGEPVSATLVFEKAGTIDVVFDIIAR